MLQTADGKGVDDLILKSLPGGGEESFQGLSESNSVWLQYSLKEDLKFIQLKITKILKQEQKSFLYSLETNFSVLRGLSKALGHQTSYVCVYVHIYGISLVAQELKNPPAMLESKETQVRSLGQDDPLEDGMATHSSILAWRIP